MSDLQKISEKCKKYNQEQLLAYYEQLSEQEKINLLKEIDETDFSVVEKITDHKKNAGKQGENAKKFSPLEAMELSEIDKNKASFNATGLDAIKGGKVAAVLLAGGMGTRLGSDNPKGMYDIGITAPKYIFQCLINNLMDVTNEAQTKIHLFVMTSDKNNDKTIAFLKEHNFFGYDKNYVHFFKQEMAPASDYDGKIYLEGKGKLATSPNGNGGWFSSLAKAGLLELAHKEGIEWLNVFAVDNVLQRIADPVFVGATIQKKCTVGAKVVKKAAPDEKVGVICLENGHPSIVEYYELTEEMMNAKDKNGNPAYNFGVILNYLFNVAELEKMAGSLPLHIVEKKIPYIDASGNLVKPEKPNGYKFETLILDQIYKMSSCLPFEVVREKEFAPIKNATGVDSVESARELLKKNGVEL